MEKNTLRRQKIKGFVFILVFFFAMYVCAHTKKTEIRMDIKAMSREEI